MKSKVSPGLFIVTILCFLLPFITVSCNGQKVATFSGIQLATGTTLEEPQVFGRPQQKHVDPEPVASMALICAVAGLVLSFLGARAALAPAISGAVGALLLVVLQSKLESDLTRQAQGMFRLEYESGFVLALIFFLVAAAWNAWLFFAGRRSPAMAVSPPLANAAATGAGGSTAAASSTCPHCGHPISGNARFCSDCGKTVA